MVESKDVVFEFGCEPGTILMFDPEQHVGPNDELLIQIPPHLIQEHTPSGYVPERLWYRNHVWGIPWALRLKLRLQFMKLHNVEALLPVLRLFIFSSALEHSSILN